MRISATAILAVAAFAIITAAPVPVSYAQLAKWPWPMFHNDAAHTELSQ